MKLFPTNSLQAGNNTKSTSEGNSALLPARVNHCFDLLFDLLMFKLCCVTNESLRDDLSAIKQR